MVIFEVVVSKMAIVVVGCLVVMSVVDESIAVEVEETFTVVVATLAVVVVGSSMRLKKVGQEMKLKIRKETYKSHKISTPSETDVSVKCSI